MATTIDSAALLTYRAAWQREPWTQRDRGGGDGQDGRHEGAQQVIDAAVQLWGGLGVVSEQPVERLYREIRALRIYEGGDRGAAAHHRRELLKEMKP